LLASAPVEALYTDNLSASFYNGSWPLTDSGEPVDDERCKPTNDSNKKQQRQIIIIDCIIK